MIGSFFSFGLISCPILQLVYNFAVQFPKSPILFKMPQFIYPVTPAKTPFEDQNAFLKRKITHIVGASLNNGMLLFGRLI